MPAVPASGRRGIAAAGAGGCGVAAAGLAPGMWPPFEATHCGELRRRDDLDRDRHEAVAGAAQLRALAEIDARPVDLDPGLVEAGPGFASCLIQKAGTAKLWITSSAVTMNFTTLPGGITTRLSTASSGGPSASVRARWFAWRVGSFSSFSM